MKPDSAPFEPTDARQPIIATHRGPSTLPVAVYVHWPFCETKCSYCDFYSVPLAGRNTESVLAAILGELRVRLGEAAADISTVFIGGGTPTTLDTAGLSRLLHALRDHPACGAVKEFSIEANPATVDADKAACLAECGVNRVSIGAQSFQPAELAFLERIHRVSDIADAVTAVRKAGITNVSLDLMFGITGQTVNGWRDSLKRAIDLGPQHIATYGLTYEPGTPLTALRDRGGVAPCEEDVEANMYESAIDVLTSAGYEHYEISNFARPGFRCEHNLAYWRNDSFVGIGPSAAGFLNGKRYKNVASVSEYVERIDSGSLAEAEAEDVTSRQFAMETLMMQLRLTEGIDLDGFALRTGVDVRTACAGSVAMLCAAGLTGVAEGRLRLTRGGLLVADSVLAELATNLDVQKGTGLPIVQTRRST